MHHAVGLVAVKEVLHGQGVANIHALKKIVCGIRQVGEVLKVARVGKRIRIDHSVVGVALHEASQNVRADESGSAGNNYSVH